MKLLHKFLLPLAACAVLTGLPPVHAADKKDKDRERQEITIEKAKLLALVSQIPRQADRDKITALLNQLPDGTLTKAQLEQLAMQALTILKASYGGSTGGTTPTPATTAPKTLV